MLGFELLAHTTVPATAHDRHIDGSYTTDVSVGLFTLSGSTNTYISIIGHTRQPKRPLIVGSLSPDQFDVEMHTDCHNVTVTVSRQHLDDAVSLLAAMVNHERAPQ